MPDAVLDYLGVFPAQILFAYAMTKMLPMRHLKLYWALQIVTLIVLLTFRSLMPFWVRSVAGFLVELIPVLLSVGPLSRRILIVVLATAVLFFMELPFGALWIVLTDSPIASYEAVRANLPQFAFVHVVHFLLLAFVYAVMYALVRRSDEGGAEMRLFIWFPLVQLILFVVLMLLSVEAMNDTMPFFVGGSIVALGFLVADVVLFASLRSYALKRRGDERARLLQSQLDAHLAEYDQVVDALEGTARLRHDLRNQVGVVLALSEGGQCSEARRHLERLRADAVGMGKKEGMGRW